MPDAKGTESEAVTRIRRIDPRLAADGWTVVDHDPGAPLASLTQHAVREHPTDNGPADYVLFVGGRDRRLLSLDDRLLLADPSTERDVLPLQWVDAIVAPVTCHDRRS